MSSSVAAKSLEELKSLRLVNGQHTTVLIEYEDEPARSQAQPAPPSMPICNLRAFGLEPAYVRFSVYEVEGFEVLKWIDYVTVNSVALKITLTAYTAQGTGLLDAVFIGKIAKHEAAGFDWEEAKIITHLLHIDAKSVEITARIQPSSLPSMAANEEGDAAPEAAAS